MAIEAGFAAEEAVAAEAWRAPETLVQTLFEAAVSLCRAIVNLRADIPKEPTNLDAVQRLERVRPSWRTDLPFDLEDQDVRSLVEDLVRVQSPGSLGLEIIRRLRRRNDGWLAFAELSLAGTIDHRRLPGELHAAIDRSSRIRLRLGGALAERNRFVATLDRVTDDHQDGWEVRPLVQGCDLPLDLNQEFRLQAISGEAVLAEFTAFAGDPIDDPVIALKPPEGLVLDELSELTVLGGSPAKVPYAWLVLAVQPDALERIRIEGERRDLGNVAGSERVLIAFDGQAELAFRGENLIWRTRNEKYEASRLTLVGDTVRRAQERVFLGCPAAWLADEEAAAVVPRRELMWRNIGSGEWNFANVHEPLGRVELAVRRKGTLLAWTRAEIVPREFRMDADAKGQTLRLRGLAGGTVAASGPKLLSCRNTSDGAVVNLVDHPRGTMLRLHLRWVNVLEITLPDPVSEPVLLDPDGRPSAAPHLSVGRLSGYRLLAPSPWTLVFELRRTGARPEYVARTVDGLMPLAAFGELIRQLLGGCEDLDAHVRLAWAGREGKVAEIGWYELDQPLASPESDSPFAILTMVDAPDLVAFSVTAPQAGVANPTLGAASTMREWLSQNLGEGPWLLSGVTRDGRRLRPKVLPSAHQVDQTSESNLIAALRLPTAGHRDVALDGCLADISRLSTGDFRQLIELAIVAFRSDVPYASVDALRALARAPRAAVYALAECGSFADREALLRLQSELPFLWCATAIEDWIAAFRGRQDRFAAKLARIGEAVDLADASLVRAIGEILDLQPALQAHLQGAFFLNRRSIENHRALVERLGRASGDLEAHAQDLVRRHGEDAEHPPSLGLSAALPDSVGFWSRYHPSFADVLVAPMATAAIAMGEIEHARYLAACRSAWLFDRDYFEAALVGILSQRARL